MSVFKYENILIIYNNHDMISLSISQTCFKKYLETF